MKPKPMTRRRCVALLRAYNRWRRGSEINGPEMPDPREIGRAIDFAVAALSKPHPIRRRTN